uniref:Uncharacterized protein n=1 Tax=Arundo donax TaxID=35708 RepID=A0A0A9D0Y2_ARUDO
MSKLVLEHQHTDLGGRLTTCNGSSSLITLGKLPFDTKEFEVTLSGDKGKETNYRVVVKHVMAISLLQLRMLLGCYPRDIQDMEPMQNDLSVSLDMPAAGFIHPLLPSDFFEKALNIHNSDRKLAIAEDVKVCIFFLLSGYKMHCVNCAEEYMPMHMTTTISNNRS